MIEYFVRPMAGIRTAIALRRTGRPTARSAGWAFASRPPAVVDGPISAGTLDLPQACARAKRLASRPFKFTLTGPHMLAKTLLDHHYGSVPELAMAIADALAEQVRASRRRRGADRRGESAGKSGRMGSGPRRRSTACCDAVKTVPAVHLCFGNYGGQSIQNGTWGKLIDYLNALQVDHIVMETAHRPRGGTRGLSRACGRRSASASASSTSNRPRSSAPTISPARSNEPRKSSGRAASPTSIPTAGSGCSSAISPTARCVRW